MLVIFWINDSLPRLWLTRVDPDPVDVHRHGKYRIAIRVTREVAADSDIQEDVEVLVERRRKTASGRVPAISHREEHIVYLPSDFVYVPLYRIGMELSGRVSGNEISLAAVRIVRPGTSVVNRAIDGVTTGGAKIDRLHDINLT